MVLDIITAAILVICAAKGLSRGFVRAFLNTLCWLIAFVTTIFLTRPLSSLMMDGWPGMFIGNVISDRFENSQKTLDTMIEGLPDIVSGGIRSGVDSASDMAAGLFTSMVISVMSFVIVFFIAVFILKIFVNFKGKKHGGGVLDKADRILGLLAGLMEGILIVFLFLAILVIFVNVSWIGISEFVVKMIHNSFFTEVLYNNNLMLLVTGGLFS